MGVVEGYENLSKITTKFGQRDIVHFRLTDGRYKILLDLKNNHSFIFVFKLCTDLNYCFLKILFQTLSQSYCMGKPCCCNGKSI